MYHLRTSKLWNVVYLVVLQAMGLQLTKHYKIIQSKFHLGEWRFCLLKNGLSRKMGVDFFRFAQMTETNCIALFGKIEWAAI